MALLCRRKCHTRLYLCDVRMYRVLSQRCGTCQVNRGLRLAIKDVSRDHFGIDPICPGLNCEPVLLASARMKN